MLESQSWKTIYSNEGAEYLLITLLTIVSPRIGKDEARLYSGFILTCYS